MSTTEPSSDFRRSTIPHWERLSTAVLLPLLILLTVWIFRKGNTYDAARYLPEVPDSGKRILSQTLLDGMEGLPPLSDTEVYSPETLFEKINGRAPAYLDFGFRELVCRTFAVPDQPEEFVDVFVFTMGSPLDAFGIYSMENAGEGEALDFASDGVRNGLGYYFRYGDAYVQVSGSSESAPVMEQVDRAARTLAERLPADDSGLEAREGLSLEGIRPETLTYIRENAYGQERLSRVFEAEVEREGTGMRVFVMHAGSPEEAVEAWEAVRGFYRRFGRELKSQGEAAGGPAWFVSESFGQTAGVYVNGNFVGGSMNAGGAGAAENLLRELIAASGVDP